MSKAKSSAESSKKVNKSNTPALVSSHSLRDLEKRFQEIFESAIDGLLVADTETKQFLFANSSIQEMLGYSEAEILKLSVYDIHPKEHLPYVISQFKKQAERKIKTARALPMLRKDGTIIYADITSIPIKIEGRTGLLGIFRDVSEREGLEADKISALEALEASEAKYRSLAESSEDAIFVINSDDIVEYVNKFAAACFGLKPSQVIGKPRASLFPPEIAEKQKKSLDWVFKSGETVTIEGPIKYLHKGIWGITMLTPIKEKDGSITSIMGVTRDITIRKREEKYREMLTKILEALNRTNLDNALEDILAAIKTTTDIDAIAIRMEKNGDYPYLITNGFSENFVNMENSLCSIGPLEENAVDQEGNKKLECVCGLVLQSKGDPEKHFFTEKGSFWTNNTSELKDSEISNETKTIIRNSCNANGYESVALIPISNENKEVFGLLQLNGKMQNCFSKELIHFLEKAASSIAVAINRKKTEDGKKLIETQLHQSQKMEAIGRLVNSTVHDYNNIISVVKGNSELIYSTIKEGSGEYHMELDALQEIIVAADRCSSLTNQLLEFSRPHKDEDESADFVEVVNHAEKMLHRLVGDNIELSLMTPPASLHVNLSPSRIEQIIINLTVNARDAMPAGGKLNMTVSRIQVSEKKKLICGELKTGNHVLLQIRDTGCGMAPEIISMIFEPFFTTKTDEGNGLGLSTVYGIVNQSGGGIEIQSKIDQGTEFRIYFPEAESAEL